MFSRSMVETIKKVATSVETKNVPIATSSVAVMDVKKDAGNAPNEGGIITFNLASNTDLKGLELGNSESKSTPALMVCLYLFPLLLWVMRDIIH